MKPEKILQTALRNPKDVRFTDFIKLIEHFGFRLSRTKGSHNIYSHPDVEELINLQKVSGRVKPYQVNQFLKLIERYDLKIGDKK